MLGQCIGQGLFVACRGNLAGTAQQQLEALLGEAAELADDIDASVVGLRRSDTGHRRADAKAPWPDRKYIAGMQRRGQVRHQRQFIQQGAELTATIA